MGLEKTSLATQVGGGGDYSSTPKLFIKVKNIGDATTTHLRSNEKRREVMSEFYAIYM
jgi:hypothetical protein